MRLAALSVRLGEGNHVAFSRSVTVPTLAASATWTTLPASAASIVERRMPRPEQTALLQAQSGR